VLNFLKFYTAYCLIVCAIVVCLALMDKIVMMIVIIIIISRSYCYTVWSAIAMILACLPICLLVHGAVYFG